MLQPVGASTPGSSPTPTLDVSFERPNLGLGDGYPHAHANGANAGQLWPHRLSASFSAMAEQIAAASHALRLVPAGGDVSAEVAALRVRLEGIEQAQAKLGARLDAMQGGRAEQSGNGIEEVNEEGDEAAKDAVTLKLEALEKKLDDLSETFKIEQQRLPVRLHNSRATIMKATLKTPNASNGKPVPGFPSTRGEFEHITKERYEALLKGYGLPLKGDTDAKRDALRLFAGIPQDGQ